MSTGRSEESAGAHKDYHTITLLLDPSDLTHARRPPHKYSGMASYRQKLGDKFGAPQHVNVLNYSVISGPHFVISNLFTLMVDAHRISVLCTRIMVVIFLDIDIIGPDAAFTLS